MSKKDINLDILFEEEYSNDCYIKKGQRYNRDFKGIWMPKEIFLDSRLSSNDKIILAEINSLDDINGCFASNEYLASFCHCSESKVSKSITKLKKYGYVQCMGFNGRTRILKTNLYPNKK